MQQDLSTFIKIIFKINAPFSFNGKIIPTKNVIELAFLQKNPSFCSTVYYWMIARSYFVTSDDEKLDDLK